MTDHEDPPDNVDTYRWQAELHVNGHLNLHGDRGDVRQMAEEARKALHTKLKEAVESCPYMVGGEVKDKGFRTRPAT